MRFWMTTVALALGWAPFLPLGSKYLAYLGSAAAALLWIHHAQAWRALLGEAPMRAALALFGLTALSWSWSSGPPAFGAAQLGLYSLLLLSPVIARSFPPGLARRGLRHFGIAAALVGGLSCVDHVGWLPASLLWSSSVQAEGNQRIVNSLMLALGAALCLIHALASTQPASSRSPGVAGATPDGAARTRPVQRVFWMLAATAAVAGLSVQDRRTGMVALPVLLAVLALASQRQPWRRLAWVVTVLALSLAAWQFSPGVRARIDEGLREVKTYQSTDRADTSWGMRLRLAEHSLDLWLTAPLLGHGVGSWMAEFRQRVQPGLLISVHTTPHNEYLLVAAQLGSVGVLLLIGLLACNLHLAWRSGQAGLPLLVVWSAIAWSGWFNVVLRDSKFALPLLLLAGMAGAASRQTRPALADHTNLTIRD